MNRVLKYVEWMFVWEWLSVRGYRSLEKSLCDFFVFVRMGDNKIILVPKWNF